MRPALVAAVGSLFLFVLLLGFAAILENHAARSRAAKDERIRRIATEAACRTIVEANLVRTCKLK